MSLRAKQLSVRPATVALVILPIPRSGRGVSRSIHVGNLTISKDLDLVKQPVAHRLSGRIVTTRAVFRQSC